MRLYKGVSFDRKRGQYRRNIYNRRLERRLFQNEGRYDI